MKEPTPQQRECVANLKRLIQYELEAEAKAIQTFPHWLNRWALHAKACPVCRDEGHSVITLCPLGIDLYRLALHETYPDKAWATSQPPVWAVVEPRAGEVVTVRPRASTKEA